MEKSNAYFTASLILAAILTAFIWLVFNVFSTQIYSFFGANEILMPLVKEYTDWIVRTMPFFLLSSYLSCVVRSNYNFTADTYVHSAPTQHIQMASAFAENIPMLQGIDPILFDTDPNMTPIQNPLC